jgi:hypothetical protein
VEDNAVLHYSDSGESMVTFCLMYKRG